MTALPLFFGLVGLRGKYGYSGSVNQRAKLSKPKAISDYFRHLIENGLIVHGEEKVTTQHRPITREDLGIITLFMGIKYIIIT